MSTCHSPRWFEGVRVRNILIASANRLNVTMTMDIKLDTLLPATEVNYPLPRCPALVCRPGRGLTFRTSGGALSNSATSTFQHLQLPGPGSRVVTAVRAPCRLFIGFQYITSSRLLLSPYLRLWMWKRKSGSGEKKFRSNKWSLLPKFLAAAVPLLW